MKKFIMMSLAAFLAYIAPSHAATASADASYSVAKSASVDVMDGKMVDKKGRKQKRKHTGLDDGPNHR